MANKISIIGATGNMGQEIAKGLDQLATLTLYSRNKEKLETLQTKLSGDHTFAQSLEESVSESDIVILAVPYSEEQLIAEELAETLDKQIVVSISNPLNDDYSDLATEWNDSAAEQLQETLGNVRVVKAFNTIFAGRINSPEVQGVTMDHFIAGDSEEAVTTASKLVSSLEHNPVHIGRLEYSRMLERMAFVNISLSVKEKYQWNSAYTLVA